MEYALQFFVQASEYCGYALKMLKIPNRAVIVSLNCDRIYE